MFPSICLVQVFVAQNAGIIFNAEFCIFNLYQKKELVNQYKPILIHLKTMTGQKAFALAKMIHEKMYQTSSGLTYDEKMELYDQYFKLIRKAAYKGHTEALFDMGQQFEDIGFPGMPNPMYNAKKCVYWYTKASEKEHAEACNNLATFHEKGEGCKKNLDLALSLYKRSADLGSPSGKKNYKIMIRNLAKGGRYNK